MLFRLYQCVSFTLSLILLEEKPAWSIWNGRANFLNWSRRMDLQIAAPPASVLCCSLKEASVQEIPVEKRHSIGRSRWVLILKLSRHDVTEPSPMVKSILKIFCTIRHVLCLSAWRSSLRSINNKKGTTVTRPSGRSLGTRRKNRNCRMKVALKRNEISDKCEVEVNVAEYEPITCCVHVTVSPL